MGFNSRFKGLMDCSQSALFSTFLYQVLILHLLVSVCTQFRHLFFGRPLSQRPLELLLNT